MHTKKKITSLPSTHHDQLMPVSTNPSVPSLLYSDPKTELAKIIKAMKNSLQYRVYLIPRDITDIYNSHSLFITQYLQYQTPQQLWNALDRDKDDVLLQKQQIVFLTKFVTELTRRKKQYANTKKYSELAEAQATIEWLQQRIIEYEKFLRNKVKEKMVRRAEKLRKRKQKCFQNEENSVKQHFQQGKQQLFMSFTSRNRQQSSRLEQQLVDKVSNSMHKFRPSVGLQKIKDTALLAKLAPYRQQKKRQYECKELDQSMSRTLDHQLGRQDRQIEHFKQVQRRRLKDRHNFQKTIMEQKVRGKQDSLILNLKNRKSELQKSEHIRMDKALKESQKISNERINWIKNSLKAYTQRQDSKKIRQIVRNHKEVTQFVNDPSQIYNVGLNSTYNNNGPCTHGPITYKYSTISNDLTYDMKNRKRQRYEGLEYENKLMRKIKRQHDLLNDDEEDDNQFSVSMKMRSLERVSGRNSLVDLYDKDLALI